MKCKKYLKRIVIISMTIIAIFLAIVDPSHTLSDSMKGYALRNAYAPTRFSDEYYENYRVINVWKYNLKDDEFKEAYNFVVSTNTWYKLNEQDLSRFKSWFVETELFNGLTINKDNIHLGDIDIDSSYYCMYDIVYHRFIQESDAEYSLRYAIFILDCSQQKYYCINKTS